MARIAIHRASTVAPTLRIVLGCALLAICGCSRAGEHAGADRSPPDTVAVSSTVRAQPDASPLEELRKLKQEGKFGEFVDSALAVATDTANDPAVQLQTIEALLAVGRADEAQSLAEPTFQRAMERNEHELASHALRLWGIARLRLRQSFANPTLSAMLARLPVDDPAAAMLRFWREQLGDATPYTTYSSDSSPRIEIPLAHSDEGSISADLNALEGRANGAAMARVFIDTGAQHTVMSRSAAEAAGVRFAASDAQLVGFAKVDARPAVLKTLELGPLTIENVPVLVGDSPALLAAEGQMALGTELMHHVRFTIDYPQRRVFAALTHAPSHLPKDAAAWRIPVWTFPQVCLAEGRIGQRDTGRVLVDTGDRSGTFVSARWARRTLPRYRRPDSNLVFKFKPRNLSLPDLALGDQLLTDWPVADTLPKDLERLDRVDVLLGRDFLWPYRLTIDLEQRVLILEGEPQQPQDSSGLTSSLVR